MARKPRHLSAEEKALWNNVAKTTTPLDDRPKPPKPNTNPLKSAPKTKNTPIKTDFKIGQSVGKTTDTKIDLAPGIADRMRSAPVTMDRKAFRKLSRGQLKPEARLDLHGMTLAVAQPNLTRFILNARADGKRLVLVITGKGRSGRDSGGPIPERKGVLRDQVPRWLASPPLSSAVIQVAKAHVSHGGDGAYYVYLRRLGR